MTVSAATDTSNVVIMVYLASGDELTICKLQRKAEREPSVTQTTPRTQLNFISLIYIYI